ncbi:hypothetical protein OEZ85_008167 [Tetradesmus obliquus]|uniref:tRNA/rRNA methyltransferase SpoU type domain-containing protein n=1 Tax=Tetradesmus obliquus TaxID=3088 RepID=A0ABY8TI28_TETOB|nr:hypothetical protein OEZ85_008167 [Tetradesmus obliquus]
MGLAVLLQYHTAWGLQPPAADQPTAAAAAAAAAAAVVPSSAQPATACCDAEQFWALLRDCLVDSETLNRKRAFRLLQLLLPEQQLAVQPVWVVFLALYELLDEFSPHLVKAAWPQISQLHPAAREFAQEDAAADVAHSSKMNQLIRAKDGAAPQEDGQQQPAEQGDALPMAFCWTSVIWTLALQHKNLQVQRMALKTLLKRHWPPAVLAQLPLAFFTGTLLPALMSPIHHKWTVSEAGSELLQLLRCLRRVWLLLVEDEQLQAAAVQELVSAGSLPDSAAGSSCLLVPLAGAMANGLLDLMKGSKKRPQLMYSLAVNALLVPQLCVFDQQQQQQLAPLHEGAKAPLRSFIRGLLQQGQKGSPRLMLALGLQLGCYVACCPQLLVWYADELRQLLLFGVTTTLAAGQDAEVQGLPSLEEGQERSLLAEPLDPELQEAYSLTDIGPRVALLTGLYQLAAAAGLTDQGAGDCSSGSSGGGTAAAAAASESWVLEVEAAGVGLWSHWLHALVSDPVLSGDRFKVGSDVHRLKVRAWQGLTAAANLLGSTRQRDTAAAAAKELLVQLSVNQPPSIKQYQEAIVAHLALQHPTFLQELLLPQISSVEKGGAATGSHILIAVQVALHSPQEQQLALLPQLLRRLLPWTNHHTHHIRTFAQLGFCALLDAKPLREWQGWEAGLGPGGVAVAGEVARFMVDNVEFQRFRRAMGSGMLGWSPAGITSPRRIFSCCLYLAGAEDTPVTFEGVPEALMDKIINFLTAERAKLREAAVYRVAGYEGGPSAAAAADASSGNAGTTAGSGAVAVGDYQRKVTPSERAVLMADVLDELEQQQQQQQGGQSGPAGTRRNDLIVVASLISKVPNLAGLARTAEVLGAGALVLADKRVTADAGFTSISVTAERWVPIEEVKEAALLAWLATKQAQGYALVGLEQTAESTCLPEYKFPSKTVLVLGREKEGIPPEIISMLDATVEIPQLGVIRSLNVHVSGAIAMYEFTKQQLAARQS